MNDQPRFCVGKYPLELTQNHDTFFRKHVLFNKKTSIKSTWSHKIFDSLINKNQPFCIQLFGDLYKKGSFFTPTSKGFLQGIGIFGHCLSKNRMKTEAHEAIDYWLLA